MGIAHLEDLRPDEILEALDLQWTVTEKLDGSFLEFGLDEEGRFYTKRKTPEIYYSESDWPAKGWTNGFRSAHTVLELLVSELVEMGLMAPGDNATVEVLNGFQPNTLRYQLNNGIFITKWNGIVPLSEFPIDDEYAPFINEFQATIFQEQLVSEDGIKFISREEQQSWSVYVLGKCLETFNDSMFRPSELDSKAQGIRIEALHLKKLILGSSHLEGWTNKQLLDLKLNKRPEHIPAESWPYMKTLLVPARTRAMIEVRHHLLQIKKMALEFFTTFNQSENGGTQLEGIVVELASGTLFKLVDREPFTKANRFTHFVKYILVGGRRPARSCFLSRTKDWPVEKRLRRLDVLLLRYRKYRTRLTKGYVINGKMTRFSYTEDLHYRVLALFADVRERIQDGR